MHHLTLLQVHAHPDDESSKGSGTTALYAARGVRCVLVCCTGGEEGELLNKSYGEVQGPMYDIRMQELEEATRILGYDTVHMLGYEDSGMEGSRANENPACFARAPLRHAVGRLVKILRQEKPDVVINYGDERGYRHPDHVRVHEITDIAFHAAGNHAVYPGAGDPYQPSKLYYTTRSVARLMALSEAHERLGLEHPFRNWIGGGGDDRHVTTKIDVGDHFEARQNALLAHRTQVGPDSFWMRLPTEVARQAYPYEDYTLVDSRVPVRLPEADLFAGLPG